MLKRGAERMWKVPEKVEGTSGVFQAAGGCDCTAFANAFADGMLLIREREKNGKRGEKQEQDNWFDWQGEYNRIQCTNDAKRRQQITILTLGRLHADTTINGFSVVYPVGL